MCGWTECLLKARLLSFSVPTTRCQQRFLCHSQRTRWIGTESNDATPPGKEVVIQFQLCHIASPFVFHAKFCILVAGRYKLSQQKVMKLTSTPELFRRLSAIVIGLSSDHVTQISPLTTRVKFFPMTTQFHLVRLLEILVKSILTGAMPSRAVTVAGKNLRICRLWVVARKNNLARSGLGGV